MSKRFTRSQSSTDNWNRQIHGSLTMHTSGSVPFTAYTKQMVILIYWNLSLIIFLLFINIFNVHHFFFLQATSLGRQLSPMELFVEMHVRSEDHQKGCNSSSTTTLSTSWYVHSTILFHMLLFSWIEYDDFFFNFQETCNNWLRKRYKDDPSTHPDFDLDLWMKARSFGGPDKNRVYGLSNNTNDNLWATHSVSTIGSSQSVLSTQYEEIVALK